MTAWQLIRVQDSQAVKKRQLDSRAVDYGKGTLEVRQLDSGAAGELGDWTARKLEGEAAGEWDSNSRVG